MMLCACELVTNRGTVFLASAFNLGVARVRGFSRRPIRGIFQLTTSHPKVLHEDVSSQIYTVALVARVDFV